MQQLQSSVHLLFIHRIQLLSNDHGNDDANHGNKNCDGNYDGNRNGNGDGIVDGDGGCDYNAKDDAVATDVRIALVVAEVAVTVISMTVVVDYQDQAGLENNRCNYFSCTSF